MVTSSIAYGFRVLKAKPGLVLLLFLLTLGAALVLSIPVLVALDSSVAETGFDLDLARRLDLVLLTDIIEAHPDFLSTLFVQLLWAFPLLIAWNVAVGVGLVHALRDDGARAFWTGVGRYFGRGFLLALLFLVPVIAVAIGTALAAILLPIIWTGEAGSYWTTLYVIPGIAILGLAVVDLMQDYGRMAIVIHERPVVESFLAGLGFPFRHRASILLYAVWFVPASLVWLLPTFAEIWIGAGLLGFLLQQIILVGRTAMTVGWVGSEVALYQEVRRADIPAIADLDTALTDEAPEAEVGMA